MFGIFKSKKKIDIDLDIEMDENGQVVKVKIPVEHFKKFKNNINLTVNGQEVMGDNVEYNTTDLSKGKVGDKQIWFPEK